MIIAFLLFQGLRHQTLQFFVDGHKTLHHTIETALGWIHSKRLILDWFHLNEKCKTQLRPICRGRERRNAILKELLPWLWRGQIDEAIAYLRTLGSADLKQGHTVDRLIGYFERNRPLIPCYALRKQLGLCNSSNRGEKANDVLVAHR